MTGVRVALDTSVAIRYLNGEPSVTARLHSEGPVALPVQVVGELFFGALNSKLGAVNYARYEEFVRDAAILSTDEATARHYADLRLTLKRAGQPIPENDLWIAACCVQHDLVLVTNDEHFSRCPGLHLEDWLAAAP